MNDAPGAPSIHNIQPWRLVVDGPVQRLVSNVGYPYLVVRLGVACADTVSDTPRLPAEETLEVRP